MDLRIRSFSAIVLIALCASCAARHPSPPGTPSPSFRQQTFDDTKTFIKRMDLVKTAAVRGAGLAVKNGAITAEQGERVRSIGLKVDSAEKLALDELAAFIRISDPGVTGSDKVLAATTEVTRLVAEVMGLLNQWGVKTQ